MDKNDLCTTCICMEKYTNIANWMLISLPILMFVGHIGKSDHYDISTNSFYCSILWRTIATVLYLYYSKILVEIAIIQSKAKYPDIYVYFVGEIGQITSVVGQTVIYVVHTVSCVGIMLYVGQNVSVWDKMVHIWNRKLYRTEIFQYM